jgi:hypothetical protein
MPLSAGPKDWDRPECDHLMLVDCRLATIHLKVTPASIKGPVRGFIVGHSPGPTGKLPLFPYPRHSSGARLAAFGGMSASEYLGKFRRVNMFDDAKDASAARARERAIMIRQLLRDDLAWRRSAAADAMIAGTMQIGDVTDHEVVAPLRLLACSKPVADALEIPFGTGIAAIDEDHFGVGVPHPSGLNRMTNDPRVQSLMSVAVRWAAGYTVRWS